MDWVKYFESNRLAREQIPWEGGIQIDPRLRAVLVESLQRFQVGESGAGRHLLGAAAGHGDATYLRALEMFVAEEQEHARLLADAVHALGGECLRGHWTDAAFVALRRVSGLRAELLVLMTAEIIGLVYYRALRDRVPDATLRALFAQIVRDEEAHLAFHYEALPWLFSALPRVDTMLVETAWRILFRGATVVVWLSHGNALGSLLVDRSAFLESCQSLFEQSLRRIFPQPHAGLHARVKKPGPRLTPVPRLAPRSDRPD